MHPHSFSSIIHHSLKVEITQNDPPTNEWINKCGIPINGIVFSRKKEQSRLHAATWMNLGNIHCEIIWSQKTT